MITKLFSLLNPMLWRLALKWWRDLVLHLTVHSSYTTDLFNGKWLLSVPAIRQVHYRETQGHLSHLKLNLLNDLKDILRNNSKRVRK